MAGVNYEDERFAQVETQKQQALTEVENTYNNMINQSDSYYQAQIDATKQWTEQQQQLQQENTDFTIEQINQQKEQANKDYIKEQSGAYTDWQKQSNKYGANAEQMASSGLTNTGYSESSQVSMYNTYQGRVATAREGFNKAVLNYDNAIKDAQLQNNSALAEIAYKGLQQQLELSLQGFQYENSLIADKMAQKQATDDRYYNRYQDVLNQINTENALAEEKRQYEQNYALQVKNYEESIRQFDAEMERLKANDEKAHALELQQLELQKQAAAQAKLEAERDYQIKMAQLTAEQQSYVKQNNTAGKTATTAGNALSSASNKLKTATSSTKAAVNTAYYQGELNSDAKEYGTFTNGYQPKGISGYGTVSKTGDTLTFQTKTLSGQTQTVTQNIWKTSDGSTWYWDGTKNKYVQLSKGSKSFGGGGRSF